MSPVPKRLEWIDYMKGIAMLFVVYTHCENHSLWLNAFYGPFFLSGFFFASGYLFHNPAKEFNLKAKLVRLTESLLVPYLIYWFLTFFIDKFLHGVGVAELFWQFAVSLLYGQKLWFVSCLLVAEVLFAFVLKINRRPDVVMGVAVVLLAVYQFSGMGLQPPLPWCANTAVVAFFFMALGYFFRLHEPMVAAGIKRRGGWVAAVYVAMVVLNVAFWHVGGCNFARNHFPQMWTFLCFSLVGLTAFYWVCNQIKNCGWLAYIGTYSLLFYFFQTRIQRAVEWAYHHYCSFVPYELLSYLEAVITTVALFGVTWLVVRFFPVLAGKSRFLSQMVCMRDLFRRD